MSKIDNRIVEMGFENKSFEKNIKQSQESLQNFDKVLNTAGTGNSFSPLGGIVDGLGSKFSLMGTIAVGALLKIGNQAVVAGQQLINSLGPAQIAAGFREYELKINSIKVMLAGGRTKEGLPVTLEMVNEELEKLNAYSDQTIYSFSDMTRNIGKFTNAGVNLQDAVQAIKGIANAAALSGANSEEASRAMYNFAQALSAGYVKLIDWKSIENANMATVEFKTQLLEAGVAAGNLTKTADGMYKVLTDGGMQELISPTKMFNQSLEKQWMTADVLNRTLINYADSTTDIGKRATEAATKVRTFTQLMDTTKEALGSGWSMTFENIFGDFDEATKLWTKVSDVTGDMINKSSEARNSMLKDWKDLGGRKQIIYGISLAFQHLGRIIETITVAFKNVFPPLTADKLMKISNGFTKLVSTLQPSPTLLAKLQIIFEGIFRAIDLGARIFGKFFNLVFEGIKFLFSLSSGRFDILDLFVTISEFFIALNKSYKSGNLFLGASMLIAEGLKWITDQGGIFVKIARSISDGLKWVSDQIKVLTNAVPTGQETEGKKSFISKLIEDFIGLVNFTKQKLAPVIDFLKKIFAELKKAISINWEINGIEGIIDIFNKILTGGLIVAISNFVKLLMDMGTGFGSLLNTPLTMKGSFLGVMNQLQVVLKSYEKNLDAKRLLSIASAIGILTLSLAVLTLLDSTKLLGAVGAISALFANLVTAMILLDKLGGHGLGGGIKGSAQLLVIATAIVMLATAMLLMKDVDASSIWALTVVLAQSVAAMLLLGKMNPKDIIQGGNAIMQLSIAINFIALAVVLLGQLDPKQLKTGLQGVSILLAELLLVSVALSAMESKGGSMLAAGAAMLVISLALLQLTGIVAILAQFNPEKLLLGIGALGAILGIVALGMISIADPQVLFGAAAMLVMAIAISMFVPALFTLGSLPINSIATALLTIAALFAILGIAGVVLTPVIVPILAIAGAVALLGIAVLATGTGLMLFGTGLALIASAGVGAIGILVTAMLALIPLIPLLLVSVGKGLIQLIITIGNGASQIMESFRKIIVEFLELVVSQIPAFVDAGLKLLLGLLEGISNNIGPIIETVFDIIINMREAFTLKIPELVKSGADLIIAFITGIASQHLRIIEAAMTTIITFINGLADAIRTNTPLLLKAVKNLGTAFFDGLKEYFNISQGKKIMKSFIDGLIEGINAGITNVVNSVKNLGREVLGGLRNVLNIASPSKETFKIGEYTTAGLINGLKATTGNVIKAAKEIGESSITALRSTMDKISDVIDSEINSSPVITPVLNLNNLRSSANSLNQLLSSGQTYNLASAKISDDKLQLETNQNGSDLSPENTQIVNEFNLNGVTIRSDADIIKLAEELYRRQENAMRSRGIRPAYSS